LIEVILLSLFNTNDYPKSSLIPHILIATQKYNYNVGFQHNTEYFLQQVNTSSNL